MSTCITAIRLINSLSAAEKRQFRLSAKKQAADADYIALFDIINQHDPGQADMEKVLSLFNKKYPSVSLDNTARYLVKLITDSLIRSKVEKDNTFNMWHGLMRVKVLQERSLPDEGYRELKRIRQKAGQSQNHLIEYITFRQELNHLSEFNFPGMTDDYLVEMQMKAKETLRMMHHIEGHYSLYELLRYRLIYSGKVGSEENKKQLNDLLLSEISLVTGKVRNSFESRKLHLLFQSFYFTDISDYKSALRSFHELNRLFEQNPALHDHPPLDYLSSLEGILDSLRSIRHYEEIPYYIDKLKAIDIRSCPDYFRVLVEKTTAVYSLAAMLGTGNTRAAIQYINELPPGIFKAYQLVNDEKQAELCFYCSLTFFVNKEYKKAHKYLSSILQDNSLYSQQPIYKVMRLLNMIIHYELKDTDYLSYDIRSYKRSAKPGGGLSRMEKMIFKVIHYNPFVNSRPKNRLFARKIKPALEAIAADKYEMQLLKYMDFTDWISKKLL